MVEVFLNGSYVGETPNAETFIQNVRQSRRQGSLSSTVNVSYHPLLNQVSVETGKGRLRRPLIIVYHGQSLLTEKHIKQLQKKELTWYDLINQGLIEYLDAEEEENAFVAIFEDELTSEHTHLELTPLSMLGLCTSLVPFANYIQSARLSIGSKNQKQALGFYAANFGVRMDMDVNLLYTPQIPVVNTIIHDLSHYEQHPSGQNLVVAVMVHKGYNMEDAIVINKASIERGMGRSTYYRPSIAPELRYSGGLMDEIAIPNPEAKGYKHEKDYRFLEEDGIIYPEASVAEEDVIIGRTSPPRFLSSMDEYNLATTSRRESSIALRHGESGVVDFVLLTENEEGNKLVQVRIRDQRIPEVGDKFTSRHGQKGVIGLIIPQVDMPFSMSGVIPDLLFSPHGIPSRMTVSHLLELIAGKTGSLSGRYIDATAFSAEKEDAIRKELIQLGFRENGTERMYNGMTGEIFDARIYIGGMYYLKLKHMVANKMHSRARGPIQLLTRQPTEGRAKEGGLRLGEMEKDTFVAHGASLLLKERFDSDKTIMPISEESGLVAIDDTYQKRRYCPISSDNAEITDVEMSYAFKLFLDELKSLCLYPKIQLTSRY